MQIGSGRTAYVTWRSSNPDVLEVEKQYEGRAVVACTNIQVTGRSPGRATVIATNPTDGRTKTADVSVGVMPVKGL